MYLFIYFLRKEVKNNVDDKVDEGFAKKNIFEFKNIIVHILKLFLWEVSPTQVVRNRADWIHVCTVDEDHMTFSEGLNTGIYLLHNLVLHIPKLSLGTYFWLRIQLEGPYYHLSFVKEKTNLEKQLHMFFIQAFMTHGKKNFSTVMENY